LDPLTAILTLKALDGLSVRSVASAQNIANAGTPGYRPLRVTFEGALTAASAKGAAAVQGVRPQIAMASAQGPDADLRLDLELANASATALRYAALVEVLNRQLQIDALAVTGSV
jgi:flagellar basal-body rod protein FlgB